MNVSGNRIPAIPNELIDAFRATPSRVVLLVGAGLSRRSKRSNGQPFPSWVELVRELLHWANSQGFSLTEEQSAGIESLLRRGDSASLIHASGWLKASIGDPLFAEFMSKTFASVPKVVSTTHELLRAGLKNQNEAMFMLRRLA
jgi:hypothetical protein